MPDLSASESHKFWHEYPDPTIYRAICFMEGVENWTLDGNPELEKAIEKLSSALDNVGNLELTEENTFIELSVFMKIGRALKLLQCLVLAHPGAASKILTYAETNKKTDDDIYALFIRRNMVFERLRLLSRIFSENRISNIIKTLGNK